MSDVVIGTAILDASSTPQWLYVYCKPAGKRPFAERVPVYPQGGQRTLDTQWCYVIDQNMLHMSPSLHVRFQLPPDETWHTMFHNEGRWSIGFVESKPHGPGEDCFNQLKELNLSLLEP
jgi:hypothetical protein